MTRDARAVERKKVGLRKARRRPVVQALRRQRLSRPAAPLRPIGLPLGRFVSGPSGFPLAQDEPVPRDGVGGVKLRAGWRGRTYEIDPANDSAESIPAHLIRQPETLREQQRSEPCPAPLLIGATSVVGGAGVVGAAVPSSRLGNPVKAKARGAGPRRCPWLRPGEILGPLPEWRVKPTLW